MTRHVMTFRAPEASEGKHGIQEDGACLDARNGEDKEVWPRSIKYKS